jgi:hypothetical protein
VTGVGVEQPRGSCPRAPPGSRASADCIRPRPAGPACDRFGDDPMARSQSDRRRDARSHSTERAAPARRLARDCFATGPVFRGRERCPEAQTRARAYAGSAQRARPAPVVATSRHRVRKCSSNDRVGAVQCGLALRPPPSAEARSCRPGRSAAQGRVSAQPSRSSKHMRQPIDRDHQNVVLDALDAPHTDEAHHADGAVTGLSSPPT